MIVVPLGGRFTSSESQADPFDMLGCGGVENVSSIHVSPSVPMTVWWDSCY